MKKSTQYAVLGVLGLGALYLFNKSKTTPTQDSATNLTGSNLAYDLGQTVGTAAGSAIGSTIASTATSAAGGIASAAGNIISNTPTAIAQAATSTASNAIGAALSLGQAVTAANPVYQAGQSIGQAIIQAVTPAPAYKTPTIQQIQTASAILKPQTITMSAKDANLKNLLQVQANYSSIIAKNMAIAASPKYMGTATGINALNKIHELQIKLTKVLQQIKTIRGN